VVEGAAVAFPVAVGVGNNRFIVGNVVADNDDSRGGYVGVGVDVDVGVGQVSVSSGAAAPPSAVHSVYPKHVIPEGHSPGLPEGHFRWQLAMASSLSTPQ